MAVKRILVVTPPAEMHITPDRQDAIQQRLQRNMQEAGIDDVHVIVFGGPVDVRMFGTGDKGDAGGLAMLQPDELEEWLTRIPNSGQL